MARNHKVAIVVPTWNNVERLKEFVEMSRTRTSSRCKVLILDDGSTDGTKEYLDTLEGDRKFETLLFAQNAGPNEMWNFGVNYLKEDGYDWIIISNDDVEYPPYEDDTKFDQDFVNAYVLDNGKDGTKIGCTFEYYAGQKLYRKENISGHCFLIRTAEFDGLYGLGIPRQLDVWYGDDWLFHSYGASWVSIGVRHDRSSTVNGPAKEAIAKRTAKDSVAWAKILEEKGWKDSRFGI